MNDPIRPARCAASRLVASPLLVLATLLLAAGCADGEAPGSEPPAGVSTAERPALETRADTVAMRLYDALGGPAAWEALPALRFDFAVARGGGETQTVARHLWNRQTGDYRVEWSPHPDTTYTALFNVAGAEGAPSGGQVYRNGTSVEAARREALMEQAYQRFINDTYWLMAPVKLFDPGVRRAYAPGSSTAGVAVITTSFEGVGLTPGDRYWLFVDEASGRLQQWAFHLQGMDDEAAPRTYTWTGYETLDTPAGPVHVATEKNSPAGGGIRTPVYPMDGPPADSMFSMPEPMLD